MEEKFISTGQSSNIAIKDMNQDIYIPITSALKRFTRKTEEHEISRFIAHVQDVNRIQEAANILKSTIKRRHNYIEDFTISVPEALLRQSRQTQRIFNIVMGAIAGISLVVGGIGIMNIMLATVLERTREIGIRRSLGATQRDIMSQFLIEAVMLSFAGGLVGIMLGISLTKVIALYAHWRTIVALQAILLAFFVSVGVGILFGVYPARRAARMDPIDALRYE
jgi:putative ABC transport system permease protein